MLTKEERAAIAARANECVEVCGSLYEVLLGYPSACNTTYEEDMKKLLARIVDLCDTSNMLELPVDKDGEVIKVGDIVYNEYGKETEVTRVELAENKWLIDTDVQYPFFPQELTHKKPVTIESLVERFEHVLAKGQMSYWAVGEICDIVDQLKKLGDSDE